SSLSPDHPRPLAGFLPVEAEAEEVDVTRTTRGRAIGRSSEVDESRFLWVEHQTVLLKAFGKHPQNPSGVILPLEGDHHVVRVPDESGFPPEAWEDVSIPPEVHDLVQIDVCQKR